MSESRDLQAIARERLKYLYGESPSESKVNQGVIQEVNQGVKQRVKQLDFLRAEKTPIFGLQKEAQNLEKTPPSKFSKEAQELVKWFLESMPFLPEAAFHISTSERWNVPVLMYRHLFQTLQKGASHPEADSALRYIRLLKEKFNEEGF